MYMIQTEQQLSQHNPNFVALQNQFYISLTCVNRQQGHLQIEVLPLSQIAQIIFQRYNQW